MDALLYGVQSYADAINRAETATQEKIKTVENIIEQINKKNTSYLNSDEVKTQIEKLLFYGEPFELQKLIDKIFEAIKNDTEIWNDADWKKQVINNYLWSLPIGYNTPIPRQTQTTSTQTTQTPTTTMAVASQNNTQDVKIPWYVYALGAGVLLLGGILLFGKKK